MNPASVFGYIYSGLRYPIEWALTHLHNAFHDVPVLSSIGAFGLAVIVVTLCIRGLLFPLFGWQLRTQRRVQAEQRLVAPQMQELRKKYKKEPQKLQEEMMKLYREHGISPFSSLSGCLPLLVQMPIIGGLYFGVRDAANSLHGQDASFLWITNLGQSASDWIHSLGGKDVFSGAFAHPQAVLLPLAAALATVVQSKMMMQPPRPDMSDQERQAYNLSKNMVFLAPVMVFFFGFSFPQGVALYWVTQSLVMIVQQWVILGWGGLRVPSWFPGAGRVTPLSFPAAGAPAAAFTPRRGQAPAPSRGGASSDGRGRPSERSSQRGGDRRPQGGRSGHGGGRRSVASQTGAARRRRGR